MKNWMFVGGEGTGWRSAVIYTMVEQVRRHGRDPFEYLRWVFGKLPGMTNQVGIVGLNAGRMPISSPHTIAAAPPEAPSVSKSLSPSAPLSGYVCPSGS